VQDDDTHAAAFIARLDAAGQHHVVAFDGCRVAWRRFGNGPPLVLLHGGHGRWLHWARNIDALALRHSVWVPDLPGYGDSDDPAAPTLDALVDATRGTLDMLIGRDTPIALAGFSFGGLAAAHLAARRPQVRQLALFGAAGHGSKRRPRGELRPWRNALQSGDTAALTATMRHNLAVHMLHDDADIDALAVRIHTDACLRTRFRSKGISLAGGLAAALEKHRAPLLIAFGEHDVTAEPLAVIQRLSEGRADCRTHIAAGAGHWVQYERAEEIDALLLEWLIQ
jgi:pimeloyl-ACP methyl ester carboxylesterase